MKNHQALTLEQASTKRQRGGMKFWCVGVPTSISKTGEIHLWADRMMQTAGGGLTFIRENLGSTKSAEVAIAPGRWLFVYRADIGKGDPLGVDHWIEPNAGNGTGAVYERGKVSQKLRFSILERDKFTCRLCGHGVTDGVKVEVDHITPVAKDGKTERDNLWTLCEDCNRGKGKQVLQ